MKQMIIWIVLIIFAVIHYRSSMDKTISGSASDSYYACACSYIAAAFVVLAID